MSKGSGQSLMTDQIKAACDRFLESRGERRISYREQMEINANKSRRMRGKFAEDKLDKVAKEIEDQSNDG
mgnify:FL=1